MDPSPIETYRSTAKRWVSPTSLNRTDSGRWSLCAFPARVPSQHRPIGQYPSSPAGGGASQASNNRNVSQESPIQSTPLFSCYCALFSSRRGRMGYTFRVLRASYRLGRFNSVKVGPSFVRHGPPASPDLVGVTSHLSSLSTIHKELPYPARAKIPSLPASTEILC